MLMPFPPFMIVPVNRCWILVAVVSGNKSHECKLYTTLCFVAPKIMIKSFSQFMCCIMYVPGSYQVFAKDKNTFFISFDWRVKSYSVNRAPGTGLMITKISLSVSYSRFLYYLPFHLCRGKSFRWKVLEGHKGAWSVSLWKVRSGELISLLLLTWCVTLGKPCFLCGPCSSLPFAVCPSK